HIVPAALVKALDVHHRHLQLHDRHTLLGGEVFEVDDPVAPFELQEGVEQLDKERLVDLAGENALEDEVGLGIREYRPHGDILLQGRTLVVPGRRRPESQSQRRSRNRRACKASSSAVPMPARVASRSASSSISKAWQKERIALCNPLRIPFSTPNRSARVRAPRASCSAILARS